MEPRRFRVWVAAASATYRHDPEKNQDRFAIVGGAGEAECAVVVCDGVGAIEGSGPVAAETVLLAASHVAQNGIRGGILGFDSPNGTEVSGDCVQTVARALDPAAPGATTMIVAGGDPAGFIAYALVGNGSLLDIEPVRIRDDVYRLTAAELVLPHISWDAGRPALRAVLPFPGDPASIPAARGLLYPQQDRVRLILAVTDGIASLEEREEGRFKGERWLKSPETLEALTSTLAARWAGILRHDDPGSELSSVLQATLDEQAAAGRLADDATVGALLVVPVEAVEI